MLDTVLDHFSIEKIEKRPWGCFYCIEKFYNDKFVNKYFPKLRVNDIKTISCKILYIEPNKKLSLQYHFKRRELWNVLKGPVGSIIGHKDTILNNGETVLIEESQVHRLIGLDDEAIIAEIWINVNDEDPSFENDIIRIDDDYDRI